MGSASQKMAARPPPKPRDENQIFVGGFPFRCNEAKIRKDFEECGEITKFNMPLDANGMQRGIAFISFATREGVEAALAYNGQDYEGRTLKVNPAGAFSTIKPEGEKKEIAPAQNMELTVFVKGLPYSCTEMALTKDFKRCGSITGMKMPKDDEGGFKGFAFI